MRPDRVDGVREEGKEEKEGRRSGSLTEPFTL